MTASTTNTCHFDDWLLPSHWASALINDDWSGYEQHEIDQIENVLFDSGLSKYHCVDVIDEGFMSCPSYWPASYELLADNYATFTFQLR